MGYLVSRVKSGFGHWHLRILVLIGMSMLCSCKFHKPWSRETKQVIASFSRFEKEFRIPIPVAATNLEKGASLGCVVIESFEKRPPYDSDFVMHFYADTLSKLGFTVLVRQHRVGWSLADPISGKGKADTIFGYAEKFLSPDKKIRCLVETMNNYLIEAGSQLTDFRCMPNFPDESNPCTLERKAKKPADKSATRPKPKEVPKAAVHSNVPVPDSAFDAVSLGEAACNPGWKFGMKLPFKSLKVIDFYTQKYRQRGYSKQRSFFNEIQQWQQNVSEEPTDSGGMLLETQESFLSPDRKVECSISIRYKEDKRRSMLGHVAWDESVQSVLAKCAPNYRVSVTLCYDGRN